MTTKYIVIALDEPSIITSVRLSCAELYSQDQYSIIGRHQETFNRERDALNYICDQLKTSAPEHGYSIIKAYVTE